ncbi:glycosyltransferase [candidate division KSB1 bacterium]
MKSSKSTKKKLPFVSLLVPSLNEEKDIAECLDSYIKQDYPKNRFEVVIADGNSTDKTVKIIKKYMKKKINIRLYKNPAKNTAIGRNICLKHAKGEIVINSSSHIVAQKEFISTLASKLVNAEKDVGGVGCSNLSPDYDSFTSRSVATVFASFFGGVKSFDQNLQMKKERFVSSIAFCAYRKKILDKIKGFDPIFWVGQDGELNIRVRKAGYKIMYTPKTYVYLHKRDTLKKFFKQMYRYGIARLKIIKKHHDMFRITFIMPMVFVLLVVGVLLYTIVSMNPIVLGACGIAYILLSWISAITVTKSPLVIVSSPFFFFMEHFAYGLGFIRGLFYDKITK